MTDPPGDDRDRPPAGDSDDRRSVWSRRIAIVVLGLFAAFLLFNVVAVLAMLYSQAAPGGGPFGR
ncbi:MAG: hypothetical protein ACJ765_11530 [Chloroflexota bacterium]